jgi:acetylornithine deacetylase/succinyl-diaminopimelate desuccinylase-like protein
MVAGLVDEAGMIAVPHLYDRVRLPTGAERARLARHGPSDDQMRRDASGAAPVADAGWSLYERTTLLPALTVSGISGGYEGTGTRAAIPARALAKMNVRIVPSQRPREVAALIAVHLGRLSPPGLRTSVRLLSLANAGEIDRRHPALVVAGDAYGRAFGRRPALVRSGGTLPAVAMLHDILAVETVLMGFALPDDNMHAPDERFRLANLWRGIEASVRFLDGLGRARTR